MLIVGANSTCDVCMESYTDGIRIPHAITCGHIFCQVCLGQMQPRCPVCRGHFSRRDIRKLYVADDVPSPRTVAPKVDGRIQRFLDDIASAAGGGAAVEKVQRAMGHSPVTSLGVGSYLDFVFDAIVVSVGCVLLLHASVLVSRKIW